MIQTRIYKDMIGTIGFITGGICIGVFAATSARAYAVVEPGRRQAFTAGFSLLAAAMFLWACAAATNRSITFHGFMLAADVLLVLATGFMLRVILGPLNALLLGLTGTVGALLLALRAYNYPTTAYDHAGLLFFNLSGGVRTIIIGAFVAIWLPAMITIARRLEQDVVLASVRSALPLCFAMLVVVTALFVSAQREGVVIGLFALIAFMFLAMSALNVTISRLHNLALQVARPKASAKGKKHAAQSN